MALKQYSSSKRRKSAWSLMCRDKDYWDDTPRNSNPNGGRKLNHWEVKLAIRTILFPDGRFCCQQMEFDDSKYIQLKFVRKFGKKKGCVSGRSGRIYF